MAVQRKVLQDEGDSFKWLDVLWYSLAPVSRTKKNKLMSHRQNCSTTLTHSISAYADYLRDTAVWVACMHAIHAATKPTAV